VDAPLGAGQLSVGQAQGAQDALLELGGQPAAADPLDQQAEQDVVGVAVGEPRARWEQGLAAGCHGDQRLRREAAGRHPPVEQAWSAMRR